MEDEDDALHVLIHMSEVAGRMAAQEGAVFLEKSNRGIGIMLFFFSSRRRHTRCGRDWSSDVCSSDLQFFAPPGIGWTDGEIRPWLVDEFKKERDLDDGYDIRLKYTAFYSQQHIDFPDNERIYRGVGNADTWGRDNWEGRVFYRKYSSEHFRDFDDYHNPTNVRLIRFADVLLMYAESIVESGGSLADAVAQVDRVRARVNLPALAVNHPTAASNNDAFLKRLQMERALELATEGSRWADIKRWGLLDNQAGIDELKARDPDFNNFVIGRHSRLPIPSSEVDNNPNITQNPNY